MVSKERRGGRRSGAFLKYILIPVFSKILILIFSKIHFSIILRSGEEMQGGEKRRRGGRMDGGRCREEDGRTDEELRCEEDGRRETRSGGPKISHSLCISTLVSFVDLGMFSRCRRKPSGIRVSPGNLVGAGSEDKIQGECLSLTESAYFSFSLCLCQGRSGLETLQ